MRKALLMVAATAAAAVLLGMGWRRAAPAVADSTLGLSKTSVFTVPSPPPRVAVDADPMACQPRPASFPQQPPVIPHEVADFLPITAADNACLDCHGVAEQEPGEPTPIPRTHYIDMRNAPDQVGDEISGVRYVCVTCHVPQSQSAPLVANTFDHVTSPKR